MSGFRHEHVTAALVRLVAIICLLVGALGRRRATTSPD
jgi:hypothetical protein